MMLKEGAIVTAQVEQNRKAADPARAAAATLLDNALTH
jgi:hypothetical protein